MFKTFKKAISVFVLAVFVLSLVPVVSFAADDYPWIGSNNPNFRGYSATINSDGTVIKGSKLATKVYEDFNLVKNHNGNFGKLPNDVVYKEIAGIDRAREVSSISFASGGTDFTLSGTGTYTQDYVYEFALCLENGSSVFGTDDAVQYWNAYTQIYDTTNKIYQNKTWSNFINITSTSLKYANKTVSYNFIPGRWYNFTFVCDFENTSDGSSSTYNYKAYVNGVSVIEGSTVKAYGLRTFRMGSLSHSGDVWVDNINKYAISDANAFTCPEKEEAVISSNNADITIDSSIDTVIVQKITL